MTAPNPLIHRGFSPAARPNFSLPPLHGQTHARWLIARLLLLTTWTATWISRAASRIGSYLWWGQRRRLGAWPTDFWTALAPRVPLRLPLVLISFSPQSERWTITRWPDWWWGETGSSRSTWCLRRGCPEALQTLAIWRGFWGGDSSTAGPAFTWRSVPMAPCRAPGRTTADSV